MVKMNKSYSDVRNEPMWLKKREVEQPGTMLLCEHLDYKICVIMVLIMK